MVSVHDNRSVFCLIKTNRNQGNLGLTLYPTRTHKATYDDSLSCSYHVHVVVNEQNKHNQIRVAYNETSS